MTSTRRRRHAMLVVLAGLLWLSPPAAAQTLEYRVVDHPDLAADAPLVVAIHGLGDSAIGFSRFVRRLQLPYRFIVPNAPTQRPGGGYSWYRVRSAEAGADVAASTVKLLALIEHVRERWPSAPPPVLIGFSQGAVMSFSMAARHPGAISGAVAISGYLVPENLPIRNRASTPPLLLIHGRSDRVVPFEEGREAGERFRTAGYDVKFMEHAGGHSVPRPALSEARRWIGQLVEGFTGRSWPATGLRRGAREAAPYRRR